MSLDTVAVTVAVAATLSLGGWLDPAWSLRPGPLRSDVAAALPLCLAALYVTFLPAGLYRRRQPSRWELASAVALAAALVAFRAVYVGPGPRPWLFAMGYAFALATVTLARASLGRAVPPPLP